VTPDNFIRRACFLEVDFEINNLVSVRIIEHLK
jgi:hypothetical protein